MRIHRNLHNAKRGGPQWVHTVKGKVAAYLDSVVLTDVTTRIQPAGQRKCQESGVRSVCAYFDGDKAANAAACHSAPARDWERVSYDPRVDDGFLSTNAFSGIKDHWNAADAVELRADGSTWALSPRWEA